MLVSYREERRAPSQINPYLPVSARDLSVYGHCG